MAPSVATAVEPVSAVPTTTASAAAVDGGIILHVNLNDLVFVRILR
jgi:hypothetical protein